jgi:Tfp pilus assembly protein PilN
MIRINLLPAEAEAPPTPLNPVIPVGGAAILSLVVVGFMYTVQAAKNQQIQVQSEQLKSKWQTLQPVIAELESLQQAKQQLTNRKSVIQQLESERLRYPQFMDDFIKLLPGNLWLTSLTTTIPAQPNTLTVGMDVTALDNYAIADLIANFETSQIFTDVDLGPISATSAAPNTGGQTMTFHLSTTYRKLNSFSDAPKKP